MSGQFYVIFLLLVTLCCSHASLVAFLDFENPSQPLLIKSGTCPFVSGFPLNALASSTAVATVARNSSCSSRALNLTSSDLGLGSWPSFTIEPQFSFFTWFQFYQQSNAAFVMSVGDAQVQVRTAPGLSEQYTVSMSDPDLQNGGGVVLKQLGLGVWHHFGFIIHYDSVSGDKVSTFYLNGTVWERIRGSPLADVPYILLTSKSVLVDDVMFFDHELSDGDVMSLYTGDYWAGSPNKGNCPPLNLPTVDNPTNGQNVSTTVLDGLTYTASATPAYADSLLDYVWGTTYDSGCVTTELINSTSASVSARFLALANSVNISVWAKEIYPSMSDFELCSMPGTLTVGLSGNAASISQVEAVLDGRHTVIPDNDTAIELYQGESVTVTASLTGFPDPTVVWSLPAVREFTTSTGTVVNMTIFETVAATASLTLVNPAPSNSSSSSLSSFSRRHDANVRAVRQAVTNDTSGVTTSTYRLLVRNQVGQSQRNVTVVSYNAIRPSVTPSPSSTLSPKSGDDDALTIGLAVGLGVGLSGLCLLFLLALVLVLALRWRARGQLRVVAHRPDFDHLAFGSFLEKDDEDLPLWRHQDQKKHLKNFEKLICDDSFAVAHVVCAQVNISDADHVARALMMVFARHEVGAEAIRSFVAQEVLDSDREETLFRANSMSTKLFNTFARIYALEFLWTVLAQPLTELDYMSVRAAKEAAEHAQDDLEGSGSLHMMGGDTLMGPMTFEVDPTRMAEAADHTVNTLQLWLVAQKLLSRLMRSAEVMPRQLQEIVRHVYHDVKDKYGEEAAYKAMGAFLFLRLVCPSLVAPRIFGLLKADPHPTTQRQLVLISKVLQNLANDTLPGAKEAYMVRLNQFITTNQAPLREYYSTLLNGFDGPAASRPVPDEVVHRAAGQLHAHISPQLDTITSALDASSHADQAPLLRQCVEGLQEE